MLVITIIILLSIVNVIVSYKSETCGKVEETKKLTIVGFTITGLIWIGLMLIIPRALSGDHIIQNGNYVNTYENAFTLGKSLGNDIFIYICYGVLLLVPAFVPIAVGTSKDFIAFIRKIFKP